jgi:hypothetical protein
LAAARASHLLESAVASFLLAHPALSPYALARPLQAEAPAARALVAPFSLLCRALAALGRAVPGVTSAAMIITQKHILRGLSAGGAGGSGSSGGGGGGGGLAPLPSGMQLGGSAPRGGREHSQHAALALAAQLLSTRAASAEETQAIVALLVRLLAGAEPPVATAPWADGGSALVVAHAMDILRCNGACGTVLARRRRGARATARPDTLLRLFPRPIFPRSRAAVASAEWRSGGRVHRALAAAPAAAARG